CVCLYMCVPVYVCVCVCVCVPFSHLSSPRGTSALPGRPRSAVSMKVCVCVCACVRACVCAHVCVIRIPSCWPCQLTGCQSRAVECTSWEGRWCFKEEKKGKSLNICTFYH